MDQLISPSHALLDPIVSSSQVGPELYKQRVAALTTSFPDLRFTIEDTIAEREKVVVSWVISGTHKGEFLKIPADRDLFRALAQETCKTPRPEPYPA